jgi:hypothetical protein
MAMSRGIPLLLGASLALGALSLLAPSAPTTDPWGWIVWGREVVHLRLDTVAGPPSWKPLPVLFTAPLSLLGGAAPAAWIAVARAGGILALAFAYRLGARLAGPVAGVVAVVALALSELWLRGLAHGYSEGLAVALLLWAIESHLDGHRGRALLLGSLVALSRPEAWPLVLAYGLLARPRAWWVAVAAPPLLWLLPDWWGSGHPFHADAAAQVNLLRAGAHPGLLVLRETWGILAWPVWACAAVALLVIVRRREWTTVVIAGGTAAWILGVAAATELGYPGSGRFLIPPAGVVCVLAGVGAARALRPRPVLGAVLALAALPWLVPRAEALPASARQSVARARFEQQLGASVRRAGGAAAILRDGRPVVPDRLWWTAGALAWDLDVPLERIGKVPEAQLATACGVPAGAVVFAPVAGTPPDDDAWQPAHPRASVLSGAGIWRLLVDRPPTLRRCAPSPTCPASGTTSSTSPPACARTSPRPGPTTRRRSCSSTAGRSTGTCGATSSRASASASG